MVYDQGDVEILDRAPSITVSDGHEDDEEEEYDTPLTPTHSLPVSIDTYCCREQTSLLQDLTSKFDLLNSPNGTNLISAIQEASKTLTDLLAQTQALVTMQSHLTKGWEWQRNQPRDLASDLLAVVQTEDNAQQLLRTKTFPETGSRVSAQEKDQHYKELLHQHAQCLEATCRVTSLVRQLHTDATAAMVKEQEESSADTTVEHLVENIRQTSDSLCQQITDLHRLSMEVKNQKMRSYLDSCAQLLKDMKRRRVAISNEWTKTYEDYRKGKTHVAEHHSTYQQKKQQELAEKHELDPTADALHKEIEQHQQQIESVQSDLEHFDQQYEKLKEAMVADRAEIRQHKADVQRAFDEAPSPAPKKRKRPETEPPNNRIPPPVKPKPDPKRRPRAHGNADGWNGLLGRVWGGVVKTWNQFHSNE